MGLGKWFHLFTDYHDKSLAEPVERIDIKRLVHGMCVVGHFGHRDHYLHQRYPEMFTGRHAESRYRIFTIFRDPLDMRCSLYRHRLREKPDLETSLFESIMTQENYFSRFLQVNESSYKEAMDRYFFIGIYENLQESFDALADKVGVPRLVLSKENVTKVTTSSSADVLTNEQVSAFKEANRLDYAIYDYAKQRYQLNGQRTA